MKKFMLGFGFTALLALSACGNGENTEEEADTASEEEITNEAASETNLFDKEDIETGLWIGQGGDTIEKENMILSNPIEYNPELNYFMNNTAYVTYLSGDEIIKTLLMDEDRPIQLEAVEEADYIRISFDDSKLDDFELTVE